MNFIIILIYVILLYLRSDLRQSIDCIFFISQIYSYTIYRCLHLEYGHRIGSTFKTTTPVFKYSTYNIYMLITILFHLFIVFSILKSHKEYFGHPLHTKVQHKRAMGYDPYALMPRPKLLPTFTWCVKINIHYGDSIKYCVWHFRSIEKSTADSSFCKVRRPLCLFLIFYFIASGVHTLDRMSFFNSTEKQRYFILMACLLCIKMFLLLVSPEKGCFKTSVPLFELKNAPSSIIFFLKQTRYFIIIVFLIELKE